MRGKRTSDYSQVRASWTWAEGAPPIHEQFGLSAEECSAYQAVADGIAAGERTGVLSERQALSQRKKLAEVMIRAGLFDRAAGMVLNG